MTTWIGIATKHIGTREIPGPKSNPKIIQWAQRLGSKVGIPYTDDDTAWCGLFMGAVFQEAGFDVPKICVRASEWAKFGTPVPAGRYPEGAVAVFTRPGGGHVGIIVGQTKDNLVILGGNQGNAVSVTQIAKSRATAIRWPGGPTLPKEAPVVKSGKTSTNEA